MNNIQYFKNIYVTKTSYTKNPYLEFFLKPGWLDIKSELLKRDRMTKITNS